VTSSKAVSIIHGSSDGTQAAGRGPKRRWEEVQKSQMIKGEKEEKKTDRDIKESAGGSTDAVGAPLQPLQKGIRPGKLSSEGRAQKL